MRIGSETIQFIRASILTCGREYLRDSWTIVNDEADGGAYLLPSDPRRQLHDEESSWRLPQRPLDGDAHGILEITFGTDADGVDDVVQGNGPFVIDMDGPPIMSAPGRP